MYFARMDKNDYDNTKLERLREDKGLSVAAVAEKLGISRQTVYFAERGGDISFELLSRFAKLYGVPVVSLLHEVHKTAPTAA